MCQTYRPPQLRIQPLARSACRGSGTDSALEQRSGRRVCAQAQADQTADVRTCQRRSVPPPCSPSGLISRCSERDVRALHRFTKCAPEPGDCEKQQIAYIDSLSDTLSDTLIGTNLRGDLKFYTGP